MFKLRIRDWKMKNKEILKFEEKVRKLIKGTESNPNFYLIWI